MKLFGIFICLLISNSSLAFEPLLSIGTTYAYDVCEIDYDFKCSISFRMDISVNRIEKTFEDSELMYVFSVNKDNKSFLVRLPQSILDSHISSMVRVATDSELCHFSNNKLSNPEYRENFVKFNGEKYDACLLGADSENQTSIVTLAGIISPMPFSMKSSGYWFADRDDYYKDRFFMAKIYLQLLGYDLEKNNKFDVSFILKEVIKSN